MSTKRLNIDILANDKSKQALNSVQGNLDKTKNSVLNLRNALLGLGVGAVLKSFVDVGKQVQNLQVRFKFLFGSAEEGKIAFDNLTKFASKVPFSLEEISRASGNLAVVAKDANDLNRILEITGNVAAVTGLDFETTSGQIQRAFSGGIGAADLFREKGVRALLGFEEGAKVSIEETVKKFEEAFSGDGRFANATDALANTLEGTISMVRDSFFNFQKVVAEQFIAELQTQLGDLNNFLGTNAESIEDFAEIIGGNLASATLTTAEAFKTVYPPLKLVGETITGLIDGYLSLPVIVQEVGIVGAILGGKKGLAGLIGLSALGKGLKDITGLFEELIDIQDYGKDVGGEFAKALESQKTNLEELNKTKEESISKNKELAQSMEQFAVRNNEIMKTINHAEIERLRKLDESVERSLKKQEEANRKKVELEKQGQDQIVDAVGDALQKVSGLNKNAFKAYQAFQIAMATVNTFRAVSNALATYPFPLNLAVGGAELARGLATVAQIRSIAPPRQTGGRVFEGQPYTVGENGRETFVPESNGTILPNGAGMGATNVYVTINANDTQGFDDLLVKRRSVIVNVINDALNSQGKEALI
jgi:hypothetical protein